MEEIKWLFDILKYLDLPNGVVGAIFGVAMFLRSAKSKRDKRVEEVREINEKAIEDKRKIDEKRRDRILNDEVGRQLDFKYSEGYKGMEKQIHDLHNKGLRSVEVRHNGEIDSAPFKSYLDSYKDSLKETAFKIVKPCIMGKLTDDRELYMREGQDQYVIDTGVDVHKSFISSLGRKTGTTDFSEYIENEVLGEQGFIDMYRKIINKAREL